MSKPVTCEKCGMRFKGMQGLAQHRLHPVNCKPKVKRKINNLRSGGPEYEKELEKYKQARANLLAESGTYTDSPTVGPLTINYAITADSINPENTATAMTMPSADDLIAFCESKIDEWQRALDYVKMAMNVRRSEQQR